MNDKDESFNQDDLIDSDNDNNPQNDWYSSGGENIDEDEKTMDVDANTTERKSSDATNHVSDEVVKNQNPKLETIKESVTELMQTHIKKLHLNEKPAPANNTASTLHNKKPVMLNNRASNVAVKPPVDTLRKDVLVKKQLNESPASAKTSSATNRIAAPQANARVNLNSASKNLPINKSASNLNNPRFYFQINFGTNVFTSFTFHRYL